MASVDHLLTRAAPTPRELRGDIVFAAVIFVGAILSATLSAIAGIYGDEQGSLQLALVYAFVLAAPLAVRRRWPATVAVIIAVAYFAAVTLRIPEVYVGNIAMFIALYTVGAWSTDRRRALIVRVAIIVGMFAWLIIVMYRDAITQADDADVIAGAVSPFVAQVLIGILVNALYFGGAYYFGERAWSSAVQRAALEQRTAELEREREVTAAQAVALDRVRHRPRAARRRGAPCVGDGRASGRSAGHARLGPRSEPAPARRHRGLRPRGDRRAAPAARHAAHARRGRRRGAVDDRPRRTARR